METLCDPHRIKWRRNGQVQDARRLFLYINGSLPRMSSVKAVLRSIPKGLSKGISRNESQGMNLKE
jgi:hypothetical protein